MNKTYLFILFAKFGVLTRQQVKNYPQELKALLRRQFVRKMHVGKNVYYALTPKALPLLESYREVLLSSVQLKAQLHERAQLYQSLLDDLRFLDEKKTEAQEFLFLGDWQLRRPVSQTQLEWVQQRYFSLQSKRAS